LERRFARLNEVKQVWRPKPVPAASGTGVFGHLVPKGTVKAKALNIPPTVMTWVKFAKTVLPNAETIEFEVPAHGAFIGMTTAVHADAPPIIRWDHEDERNPVAWYCYRNGSSASKWNLTPGWVTVLAVVPLPTLWGSRPMEYLHEGVMLALEGANDTKAGGNCLFPEILRPELHEVHATMEAYSKSARLGTASGPLAQGYDLRNGAATAKLRVMQAGLWSPYTIDRWD
jgi:hypothetical protein